MEALLNLAWPIARQRELPLMAISVVEVPRQMPIHEGMRVAHHRQALLDQARKIAAERKLQLDTRLVIAHHAADGLIAAVQEHKGEALVMGWKGYTNTRDRLFGEVADKVIRLVPSDLVLFKMGKTEEMKTCLLPTSGGPNAKLAASILGAIAGELGITITAGHIVSEHALKEERDTAEEHLEATLERLDASVPRQKKIIESKSIAGGIAKAGREFDLIVIGAAKEPWFRKVLFGEIPEKVARYSPSAVMVVKRYEGPVKSILKRVLG